MKRITHRGRLIASVTSVTARGSRACATSVYEIISNTRARNANNNEMVIHMPGVSLLTRMVCFAPSD